MVEVRLRDTAEHDLHEIGIHTAEQWSEAQAEIYIGQILDAIERLATYPLFGQDIGWLRAGYRRCRAGSHLIFYVFTAEGDIEIARVLHERADVLRHLGES